MLRDAVNVRVRPKNQRVVRNDLGRRKAVIEHGFVDKFEIIANLDNRNLAVLRTAIEIPVRVKWRLPVGT